MSLAEIQTEMRRAVVDVDASRVAPLLVGGRHPRQRLAVHQRHYETSLTTAILGKFPATAWLVGSSFVTEAARRYICERPPQAPCIAEYGATFPQFISECPGAGGVPYLRDFAELEWRVGQASIAIYEPAVSLHRLSAIHPDILADARPRLQPGLFYQQAFWPVDELMKLYLTGAAPGRLAFDPTVVWLEVRGARGEFQLNRLGAAGFTFRTALLQGRSLGEAAESALARDPDFDVGQALLALIAGGLAVAVEEEAR